MVVYLKNNSEFFISKDFQSLSEDSLLMTSEIPKLLFDDMETAKMVLNGVKVALVAAVVGSVLISPLFM